MEGNALLVEMWSYTVKMEAIKERWYLKVLPFGLILEGYIRRKLRLGFERLENELDDLALQEGKSRNQLW